MQAPRQPQPDLVVHVLAADVHDLFAREQGEPVQPGHRIQQPVDTEGTRRVAVVAGIGLRTGDRAAGAQDMDSSLHATSNKPGGAHAAADAHRDDDVLDAAALALDQRVADQRAPAMP